MKTNHELKVIVKDKYGQIAREVSDSAAGAACCGCGCSDPIGGVNFAEGYDQLQGYVADADLGLGCGLPTEHAGILPGQTILDLGSGAGNDVFVARSLVGDKGRVIGVDMVPEMIERADQNNLKLGHANVEFRLGEIEALPMSEDEVDVVVSNCVLNLVPDKERAFAEIHRVLRPGGHFCISDIVLEGELPTELAEAAILYAGCVAGAQQREQYLATIAGAGFSDIEVKVSREIRLPDEILSTHLDDTALQAYRQSGVGVHSITVVGRKG